MRFWVEMMVGDLVQESRGYLNETVNIAIGKYSLFLTPA